MNTGGLPLSTQEIRHALNQGKASETLTLLASTPEFKRAIDNSIRDDRMGDRECVLRFLAFKITSYINYRMKEYDSFLNDCMAIMNTMSAHELADLDWHFRHAMKAAYHLFGKDAFRKRYREDAPCSPINKALFEAWSVNLDQLDDKQLDLLITRKDMLKARFIDLMNNRDFNDAISQGTGDIKKVQRRFNSIKQLIEKVLA